MVRIRRQVFCSFKRDDGESERAVRTLHKALRTQGVQLLVVRDPGPVRSATQTYNLPNNASGDDPSNPPHIGAADSAHRSYSTNDVSTGPESEAARTSVDERLAPALAAMQRSDLFIALGT